MASKNTCTEKFVPQPQQRAFLSSGRGQMDMEYYLRERAFLHKPSIEEAELLTRFYDILIGKGGHPITTSTFVKKTFGSTFERVDPMMAIYAPVYAEIGLEHEPEPVRGLTCVDDGNIKFKDRFLETFTTYKKEAFAEATKDLRDEIKMKAFRKEYPALKQQILDIANDKKASACVDLDFENPFYFDVLRSASAWLKTASGNPVFKSTLGANCKGTNKTKRHIVQKIATKKVHGDQTVLDLFEEKKQAQIDSYNRATRLLKKSISDEAIDVPFWKKNDDTCYYYLHNPHRTGGFFGGGGLQTKEDAGSPNITTRIPILLDVPGHPSNGWGEISGDIHVERMVNDTCPEYISFYSPDNLKNATPEDKKFFNRVGYEITPEGDLVYIQK